MAGKQSRVQGTVVVFGIAALDHACPGEQNMNRQQIAAVYDSLPEDKQDMPRDQFIKRAMSAIDPASIAADANAIARGRIQKAQIDAALRLREQR